MYRHTSKSGGNMKVSIELISKEQNEEIIIKCHEMNEDILKLLDKLKTEKSVLLGYQNSSIYRINFSDVYYFESVDNKVFIYCKNKVYECKQKLYELQQICDSKIFFRASKSIIINLSKISFVKPTISGRFEARLDNEERVSISRKYVPVLKSMLGL